MSINKIILKAVLLADPHGNGYTGFLVDYPHIIAQGRTEKEAGDALTEAFQEMSSDIIEPEYELVA